MWSDGSLYLYENKKLLIKIIRMNTIMPTSQVNRRFIFQGLLLLFFFVATSTRAQITQLPYFCGFDSQQDTAGWVLNPVSTAAVQLPNKWAIGQATSNMGLNSLYISADGGMTNDYVNKKVTVMAYKEFVLPAGQSHALSFHYKMLGDATCQLYVAWVPEQVKINSMVAGSLPAWVTNYKVDIKVEKSAGWLEAKAMLAATASAVKRRLVFIWVNEVGTLIPPPVAIDNIQIVPGDVEGPTAVTATRPGNSTAVDLQWVGNAERYDLMYMRYNNARVDTIYGIAATKHTLLDLPDGVYNFWVRAVNPTKNTTSAWAFSNTLLVYDPSNYCVDYMNLDVAECRTGFNQASPNRLGKVDNGFRDAYSQHTLHYIQGEKDAWTNYQLSVMPPNSKDLAVVRLGNWAVTGSTDDWFSESVTYDMGISRGESKILLLKYAVVVQDPADHPATTKPHFTIEILDRMGSLLDATCGYADFTAGYNTQDWVNCGSKLAVGETTGSYANVFYKDWTTIGIDLTPYAGQRIKIRLTTNDCKQGGHFAYAYFALDCEDATIEGVSCSGGENGVTAPIGFKYAWYPKNPATNPHLHNYPSYPDGAVCKDRTFYPVKEDKETYICMLTSLEAAGCQLPLEVSLQPILPDAQFTPFHMPSECKNLVRVDNTSLVTKGNDVTDLLPETYYWDFGEGAVPRTSYSSDRVIWVEYPEEGAQVTMKLITGISNDECQDSILVPFTVPAIGARDTTIVRSICPNGKGRTTVFGQVFREAGEYVLEGKTKAGCDSTIYLRVEEIQMQEQRRDTTICQGDSIWFDYNGRPWFLPGEYQTVLKSKVGGCDSIRLYCTLTVLPKLQLGAIETPVCADAGMFRIPYQGDLDYVALTYSPDALAEGFVNDTIYPENGYLVMPMPQKPDVEEYTFSVKAEGISCTSVEEKQYVLQLSYPWKTIGAQKWNDVLTVVNADYNDYGDDFDTFQWYRNNAPIAGANKSYYYLAEGAVFNGVDEYYVAMRRTADGKMYRSCGVVPQVMQTANVAIYPSAPAPGQRVQVVGLEENCRLQITGVMGELVNNTEVMAQVGEFNAPTRQGIYVVNLLTEDGKTMHFKLLVR